MMAQMCEGYWLFDLIISYQIYPKMQAEEFQVWQLGRVLNCRARVTATDGNDKALVEQDLDFTDFPLPEGIKLYLIQGVILLPSEY
jgi:hypothetical protein